MGAGEGKNATSFFSFYPAAEPVHRLKVTRLLTPIHQMFLLHFLWDNDIRLFILEFSSAHKRHGGLIVCALYFRSSCWLRTLVGVLRYVLEQDN